MLFDLQHSNCIQHLSEHVDVATTYNNVGIVHRAQGDPD